MKPAAPVAPKWGRRTYLLDRGFQLKYIVVLAVVGAGVSALFGTMMYLTHVDAVHAMLEDWSHLSGPRSGIVGATLTADAARNDVTMLALTAGMAALMGAALSLFGVLITHRVAGPVYVMSHYVGILAQGKYPIMRPLRKTDELRPFFERFQSAVEAVRQREAEEAATLDRALTGLAYDPNSPEATAALASLRALRDRKRDATDRVDAGGPGLPAPK